MRLSYRYTSFNIVTVHLYLPIDIHIVIYRSKLIRTNHNPPFLSIYTLLASHLSSEAFQIKSVFHSVTQWVNSIILTVHLFFMYMHAYAPLFHIIFVFFLVISSYLIYFTTFVTKRSEIQVINFTVGFKGRKSKC